MGAFNFSLIEMSIGTPNSKSVPYLFKFVDACSLKYLVTFHSYTVTHANKQTFEPYTMAILDNFCPKIKFSTLILEATILFLFEIF